MTYYCFLCNENHDDSPTKEHFIPSSLDCPEHQWLPVCKESNTRSNFVFDNDARDILYWVRFKNSKMLKRSGQALLYNGTLKRFKFAYNEDLYADKKGIFRYLFDKDTNTNIPSSHVYAIAFPVGLIRDEQKTLSRGLAKISIGAIAYLLKKHDIEDHIIRNIFQQTYIDAIRHFALNLPWCGNTVPIKFSLGRSDVLNRLQQSCENPQKRNHVISINFYEDNSIHVEGMLYSEYGWILNLPNKIPIEKRKLHLENSIEHMKAPDCLRDLTQSHDSICIINPDYRGKKPDIPSHWHT